MYNPTLGRWTTQDPIGFDAGDVNLYRYVGNSPASLVDPTGLAAAPAYDEYIKVRPKPRLGRPLPPATDFYNIVLSSYSFDGVSFTHKGLKCKGDVSISTYGERRFKAGIAIGDDVPFTNFASYVLVVKEYANVECECDGKKQKYDDFTIQYDLGVRLIGVFIAPTLQNFSKSFKPTSYETFDAEYIAGLLKLKPGHPSDKKP